MKEALQPQHHGLWELAVLCLLREDPMHPYEMRRLLRTRHKDELLVLKSGSLYHAISRLLLSRLIEAVETTKNGRRPERTTYRLTADGEMEGLRWLRQMIAAPRRESSEFMACLSFILHLTPRDAIAQLEQRAQQLDWEIAGLTAGIKDLLGKIGRINLIEEEYLRAMRQAELQWVRGIVDDLRSGELAWDLKKILREVRASKQSAAEAGGDATVRRATQKRGTQT
jgi:DNA-binding PadR family transcriptional regulator